MRTATGNLSRSTCAPLVTSALLCVLPLAGCGRSTDPEAGSANIYVDKSHSKLSDEDLESMQLPARVTTLDLTGNDITDAGVARLAGMKDLEHLEHLKLDKTKVTAACMADIKKFPNLSSVSLVGTPFTLDQMRELWLFFESRKQPE